MKTLLLVGLALTLAVAPMLADAHHIRSPGAAARSGGDSVADPLSYVITVQDILPLCESYGTRDPVNNLPLPHAGLDATCYANSNSSDGLLTADGNYGCTPGAPTLTNPFPQDTCTIATRAAGTCTLYRAITTSSLTGLTIGYRHFTAALGASASPTFVQVDESGICVDESYTDVINNGHVELLIPRIVIEDLSALPAIGVVVNALPLDAGHVQITPGVSECPGGFVAVGGIACVASGDDSSSDDLYLF